MDKNNKKNKKRSFVLLDENGCKKGIYVGATPRVAAMKAAIRGYKNIVLRERKTLKLHYYIGSVVEVPVPDTAPAWIKKSAEKHGGKIKKANVRKVKTGRLKYYKLSKNDKSIFDMMKP